MAAAALRGMMIRRLELLGMLLLTVFAAVAAYTLKPNRTIAQYRLHNWSVVDGAPSDILALAEGSDGYLWVGGYDGLYRFDGTSFDPIKPSRDDVAVKKIAISLLPDPSGDMWVGFSTGDIQVYRGGNLLPSFTPFPKSNDSAGAPITHLVRGEGGEIWAVRGSASGGLLHYAHGRWEAIGADWGLPAKEMTSIAHASDGAIWVAGPGNLLRLGKGARGFERQAVVPQGPAALAPDRQGNIWISDNAGTRTVWGPTANSKIRYRTPGAVRRITTFFDSNNALWGFTGENGLFRVNAQGLVERFDRSAGLSGSIVGAMLQDRHGSIWIGTNTALGRLSDSDLITEPALKRTIIGNAINGDSQGNVFIATPPAVFRAEPGQPPKKILRTRQPTRALCPTGDGDTVVALDDALLWSSPHGHRPVALPAAIRGRVYDCAVDRSGAIWLSGRGGGIFAWTRGTWRKHELKGPGESSSGFFTADAQGRIFIARDDWFGALDGRGPAANLEFLGKGGRITAASPWRGGFLLGGTFGVAYWSGGKISLYPAHGSPHLTSPRGIAVANTGSIWVVSNHGLYATKQEAWVAKFQNPKHLARAFTMDTTDGLPDLLGNGNRDVVAGGDGRVWVSTADGVAWAESKLPVVPLLRPLVHIRAISADGKTYRDPTFVKLPPASSHIRIEFSIVNLGGERLRFLYRLKGGDGSWVQAYDINEVNFQNLAPGTYTFEVAPANVYKWVRNPATITFEIPPTFIQSWTFRFLVGLALATAIWIAHILRVRQMRALLSGRLEVRLAERERIARELHDTLLQGFQGLILRLQALAEDIPPDADMRRRIDTTLDQADEMMIESRERVHELRGAEPIGDLSRVIARVGESCDEGACRFRLVVEGETRPLHPLVSREVGGIAEEALRNAFAHSQAKTITAILSYGRSELRFEVRDDGVGICPQAIEQGVDRHFGLLGMRERAARIEANLTIARLSTGGTAVIVSVPARAAYPLRATHWRGRM